MDLSNPRYENRLELADLVELSLIIPDLQASDVESVLREMLEKLVVQGKVHDEESAFRALLEREIVGTAIGRSVAFPHAEVPGVANISLVVGISRHGVDFNAIDHKKVRLFFLFVFPKGETNARLRLIAQVMKLVRQTEVREAILQSDTAQEIQDSILEHLGVPR